MSTLFSKIAKGEIASYKIAETDNCFAFLDVAPIQKGHTLVIPKLEIDNLFDLDDSLLAELMSLSKRIAKAMERSFDCQKIGVTVIGLEVPHAHIHLVPIKGLNDMDFTVERLEFTQTEFKEIQSLIISNLK